FPLDPMWSWLGFHVMTTEDMDPDDLQLITNQKIPDVDQSDPVHKPESMELGAKIINLA
ncbi:9313_t:CDS:2, partial [Rhizophagus irregularis]